MSEADPFATEPPAFDPEQRTDRFLFRRSLASGGLGVVTVCLDTELNREVAVKEILEAAADDPRAQSKFTAEAQITGMLEHPGVVPVYSLGAKVDGRPYYAMRLLAGSELRDPITSFHRDVVAGAEVLVGPKLRQLIQKLIDVCNVIEYAHSRGVLHRDIKSSNVMVGRYGQTLVIDWGLAKIVGENAVFSLGNTAADAPTADLPVTTTHETDKTQDGSVMGTIAYAPPEQLNGQVSQIDSRSDTFSLAALLYEILTGKPPCAGMNRLTALKAIQSGELPAAISVYADVPAALNSIVMKGIASDKTHRYQSADALKDDLQSWLDDEPVSSHVDSLFERISRWRRRHETLVRWATISLAVVTLVSLFAAYRINVAKAKQEAARTEATRLYQLARAATDNLLTQTSDRLSEIPDATDVQRQLLVAAADSYRQMAAVRSSDPDLIRESAKVSIGLARVQRDLGETDAAVESLGSARTSLGRLDSDIDRILIAETYIEESRMHGVGDVPNLESSRSAISSALPITESLIASKSPASEALLVRGQAMIQRGNVAVDQGDNLKAEESFRAATTVLTGLLQRELDQTLQRNCRLELLRAYLNNAFVRDKDDPKIVTDYELAMKQADWLQHEFPTDPQIAKESSNCLNNFGDYLLYDAIDLSRAEKLYQQSADSFRDLMQNKPLVVEYKEFFVLSAVGQGTVANAQDKTDVALVFFESANSTADLMLEQNPNRQSFRNAAAKAKTLLAKALTKTDPSRAEELFKDAISLLSKTRDLKTMDFAVHHFLTLLETELQPNSPDGLPQRIDILVTKTANLKSPRALYTTALMISQSLEHLKLHVDGLNGYTQTALDRLAGAIKQDPTYWKYASEDDGFASLRKQRPEAFNSLEKGN